MAFEIIGKQVHPYGKSNLFGLGKSPPTSDRNDRIIITYFSQWGVSRNLTAPFCSINLDASITIPKAAAFVPKIVFHIIFSTFRSSILSRYDVSVMICKLAAYRDGSFFAFWCHEDDLEQKPTAKAIEEDLPLSQRWTWPGNGRWNDEKMLRM